MYELKNYKYISYKLFANMYNNSNACLAVALAPHSREIAFNYFCTHFKYIHSKFRKEHPYEYYFGKHHY